MRITKAQILQTQKVINKTLERKGYNHRLYTEWAYGQPRVYLQNAKGGTIQRELSPRETKTVIFWWLNAYLEGLQMGLELREG